MASDDVTARPVPRPGPHHGASTPGIGSQPDSLDPEIGPTLLSRIGELMDEVDEVGASAEGAGEVDLVALARQTQLLEQAHEMLTTALAEVDRR